VHKAKLEASFSDPRSAIASISGEEVAARCKPVWGLNAEGEIQGIAREIGLPGLWYMMGERVNLPKTLEQDC
jgi:hypothetical protein